MKKYIEVSGVILIFIVLIGLAIWWNIFRYKECVKVGHSKTYCILNIGSK